VLHCKRIVATGTSSDQQLRVFGAARARGHDEALREVCAWIARTTASPAKEREAAGAAP
jgi:hypothetical protein